MIELAGLIDQNHDISAISTVWDKNWRYIVYQDNTTHRHYSVKL